MPSLAVTTSVPLGTAAANEVAIAAPRFCDPLHPFVMGIVYACAAAPVSGVDQDGLPDTASKAETPLDPAAIAKPFASNGSCAPAPASGFVHVTLPSF